MVITYIMAPELRHRPDFYQLS